MALQKSERGTQPPPGVLLACELRSYSENRPENQGARASEEALAALGFPEVVIEQRANSRRVRMLNRPWGWPNPDRVFLGLGGRAARYAEELGVQIARAVAAEQERLDRAKLAYLRERVAIMAAGIGANGR